MFSTTTISPTAQTIPTVIITCAGEKLKKAGSALTQATAVIQTTGYCLAAVGPVVMGWVHERSGGWVAPFSMVAGVLVLMTVCAQIAARTGEPAESERVVPASVLEGGDERPEAQGGTE